MLSWNFEKMFEGLGLNINLCKLPVPMAISELSIFGNSSQSASSGMKSSTSGNCLINFNQLIVKNYYNKLQFQFFFSDEKVVQSCTYASVEEPALIVGTNYGRIFIVPMF